MKNLIIILIAAFVILNISFTSKSAEAAVTLNLQCFVEGYYNPVSNSMSVPININVSLITSGGAVAGTVAGVTLNTSGNATVNFPSVAPGLYYIKVTGSNFIETWSKTLVNFTTGTGNHNFKTVITQAFGNNMIQIGFAFCFYAGDVNQDGIVDASDISEVENKVITNQTGVEDLTGDGIVDIEDLLLVSKNACLLIFKATPF